MTIKKRFTSRRKFQDWVKRTAGIVFVAISCSGSIAKVQSNIGSTSLVRAAVTSPHFKFPKGTYEVEYISVSESNEDVAYSRTIFALGYSAKTANSNIEIGDHQKLLEAVQGEEYFLLSDNSERTLSIIKQPNDPVALDSLINNLKKSRAFFSIENGSGYMELNYFNGKKI